MITMIRSELYRMATIRSSWLSLALFGVIAAAFGIPEPYFWALFTGLGAFGISALTVAQSHQHHTIALLYLSRPRRITVLFAQVLTTVVVAVGFAMLSGLTVIFKEFQVYLSTLYLVPVMAVFGAAVASVVRRASWLLFGFAVWFVIVEGLIGKLNWNLPISSYLNAVGAKDDAFSLAIFVLWAIAALGLAVILLPRDLSGD
jgi:ABC-2 type transport system ATP-binding protein